LPLGTIDRRPETAFPSARGRRTWGRYDMASSEEPRAVTCVDDLPRRSFGTVLEAQLRETLVAPDPEEMS
jgi:hypothetical protein